MNLELYDAARTGLIWRDMNHFGRFLFKGKDAAALLHHLTTQDTTGQKVGEAREAILLSNKARVLDWLTVLRLESDLFRVITSPNRRDMIVSHAQKFILFRQDVKIEAEAESTPMWGVFGPLAQQSTSAKWPTQRLPGGGYLFFESPPHAMSCDNETFNVLRIEAGIPVTGLELTEEINPWEAGIENTISLAKGCYNGQEVVARLHAYKKIKQQLFGLKLEEIPASLPQKLESEGKNAGFMTSAIESPRFGPIGLGYVRSDYQKVGETLNLDGQMARVVSLPFS